VNFISGERSNSFRLLAKGDLGKKEGRKDLKFILDRPRLGGNRAGDALRRKEKRRGGRMKKKRATRYRPGGSASDAKERRLAEAAGEALFFETGHNEEKRSHRKKEKASHRRSGRQRRLREIARQKKGGRKTQKEDGSLYEKKRRRSRQHIRRKNIYIDRGRGGQERGPVAPFRKGGATSLKKKAQEGRRLQGEVLEDVAQGPRGLVERKERVSKITDLGGQ